MAPHKKISKREIEGLIHDGQDVDNYLFSLKAAPRLPRAIRDETLEVIALARKFNREVVIPRIETLDLKMKANPTHLPWDFVEKANEWGLYTLWIPKIFGGKGYNMPSMSYFLEEVGSACLAMANLIGVHYLGVATLCATWNAGLIDRICRDVAAGEKSGIPCLISLAITEPEAGTDVEEVDLVDKATLSSQLRRVDGGYVMNGTKVFISNGHLSRWHMVVAYQEGGAPSENTVVAAVETGTDGFSFGRMERKMGQKACPASELVFKNCFIPDENVGIDPQQMASLKRNLKESAMQFIDYIVAVTRAGVGAFGTAAARAAFEAARAYALDTRYNGSRLINQEWVQCRLADMYKNMAIARLTYVEANYAGGMYGFFRLLQNKYVYYGTRYLPRFLIDTCLSPLMKTRTATWLLRKLHMDGQMDSDMHRTSGPASLSKFAATDAGIKNCQMAIELMGIEGLRHDQGVEKCLRDAKLLQIYEGTNQLNRLNLFKCLIARNESAITIFSE